MQEFDLNEFLPITEFHKVPSILIIDTNSTNKSELITKIYNTYTSRYNAFNSVVICGENVESYANDIPNVCIKEKYSYNIIIDMCNAQQTELQNNNNKALLVFDNCIDETNCNDGLLTSFLINNRHYQIMNIIIIDDVSKIPILSEPWFWSNIDCIFICDVDSQQKRLLHEMFGGFPAFSEIMDNYDCLVFNQTVHDPNKRISWYLPHFHYVLK